MGYKNAGYQNIIVRRDRFGISEDFTEHYQSLDARFIKNKSSTFFLKATGDSMAPTILAGDILVVDRSIEIFHNRVCVINLAGELTCKRLLCRDDGIIIQSDNPKYKRTQIFEDIDSLLWGVVIAKACEVY